MHLSGSAWIIWQMFSTYFSWSKFQISSFFSCKEKPALIENLKKVKMITTKYDPYI